jgi:SAM-dependent methyltransferase
VQEDAGREFLKYVHQLPSSASFTGKGFLGYNFGSLESRKVEILYVESELGHDTFFVSKKMTRFYYIIDGAGSFTIGGGRYEVGPGMLVEVPPRVEFTYSGKMKMLALGTPQWTRGNEQVTRWNPDVTGHDSPVETQSHSFAARLVRARVLGKSPAGAFLRINQAVWNALPAALTNFAPVRAYGKWLHAVTLLQMRRAQALSTYFFRNRAELELIQHLVARKERGDVLRVAVLGCSTGAEAYSVAWAIRSARPDLKLHMQALDISRQAVEFAEQGRYSLVSPQLTDTSICSAMSPAEVEQVFDRDSDSVTVKSWIKQGIEWRVGDAGDPDLAGILGQQDIVIANNFLCHMEPPDAERCLRAIARLVRPGGRLFVSGIDLDVRSRVAADQHWEPIQEMLEEIHEQDRKLGARWPCHYAGIEPLNKKRHDWRLRYAAGYQLTNTPADSASASLGDSNEDLKPVGAGSTF